MGENSGLRRERESTGKKASAEEAVQVIWRKRRRRFSAEEKIRIERDARGPSGTGSQTGLALL
jgi:hypothetical protein